MVMMLVRNLKDSLFFALFIFRKKGFNFILLYKIRIAFFFQSEVIFHSIKNNFLLVFENMYSVVFGV